MSVANCLADNAALDAPVVGAGLVVCSDADEHIEETESIADEDEDDEDAIKEEEKEEEEDNPRLDPTRCGHRLARALMTRSRSDDMITHPACDES